MLVLVSKDYLCIFFAPTTPLVYHRLHQFTIADHCQTV